MAATAEQVLQVAKIRNSRRVKRTPRGLLIAGLVVTLVLLLPMVFLVIEASQAGWSQVLTLLFRPLTLSLLWNTVRLTVMVTALATFISVSAAWLIERSTLPWARLWTSLIILPVAIPDFLVAFGWVSVAPWVSGYWGAVLIMTLGLYPLAYLPISASFRAIDPEQEEVARNLGFNRWQVFRRITLRQSRSAILGGCLLVALPLLTEYGAFEMLRFQTFTTTIFAEFQIGFDTNAACALSLVLFVIGLLIVLGEGSVFERGRTSQITRRATSRLRRVPLGRATIPVLLGFTLLALCAIGMPVGITIFWLVHGGYSTLPASSTVLSATLNTVLYGLAAAALATLMATPVAILAIRHRTRVAIFLDRTSYLVLALPGLVIALALVYISSRYIFPLYQTSFLLVFAYAVLFFPFALVSIKVSLTHTSKDLEDVARGLGVGPLTVFRKVTLPLIGPGLAAAFCLVFLSAVTELTTTLLLIPTTTQTLTTQFWAFSENASYGAAAPYAVAMLIVALVPGYLLGRWFNRVSERRTVA